MKKTNKKPRAKIIISSHSGFCFGVRRALNIAKAALKERKNIYSLGPIIHNPQVVREFQNMGLRIARRLGDVKSKKFSILIPSHGASPEVLQNIQGAFIDTTCPLVERVQKIVKNFRKKGYFIIIVGDKNHPEVKGLAGMAGKKSLVLKNKEEAKKLNLKARKIALISQTTASLSNFKDTLSEISKKDVTELVSFNTVCKNTIDRQKEGQGLAKRVEAMIVIGGKNSANTSRLAEACKKVNRSTYHVESKDDLKINLLRNKKSIGIATGASTPPYAIQEIVNKINEAMTRH